MEQYDINPEIKRLYELKQKQRNAAKAYYRNLLYNPYRPPNDGALFDLGIHRYSAMSSYHVDHFKPSTKTYFKFFACMSPIVIYFFYLRHWKKEKEEFLRSGVVKYEDRNFKLRY